jgi:hypothetical protein
MKRFGLIVLLLFTLTVSTIAQTVSYDSSSGSTGASVSTLSWSHTCTGRGLTLIVSVAYNGYPANQINSVTYAGHALTAVPTSDTSFGTYNIGSRMYILVSAPTGTGTVTVTTAFNVNLVAEAVSFKSCTGTVRGVTTDGEFGATITSGMSSTQQYGGIGDMQVVALCWPTSGSPAPTAPLSMVAAGSKTLSNVGLAIYYQPYTSSTTLGFGITSIPGGGYTFSGAVVEQGTFAAPAAGSLTTMGVG